MRILVADCAVFHALGLGIPVPVARVGVGLDAIATDVEPYRRIEGRLLLQEQVGEFVVEDGRVVVAAEVSALDAPVANGLSDAGHELADAGLALGRVERAVQILAGDDVGRGHRPVLGDLDVFLLEDDAAVRVGDLRQTELPLKLVVRRDAGLGEEALEGQAGGALLGGELVVGSPVAIDGGFAVVVLVVTSAMGNAPE